MRNKIAIGIIIVLVLIFDFKDGLPIKLNCRNDTVLVGADAIVSYQNRHENISVWQDSIIDITVKKSNICPIHKIVMKIDTVPNIGHANLGLDYVMASPERFPYSSEFVMGNAYFNKAITFVCKQCIEAEKQWRKEQESEELKPA